MPSVTFSREIPLAPKAVYSSAAATLDDLAAQSRLGSVALSAHIGTSPSQVSVPIQLTITKRSSKDDSISFTFKSRSAEVIFPQFKGTMQALAMAPSRTNLRMKGTYRVPLGPIGSTANAAGLHRIAEHALSGLFARIADATVEAIRNESFERERAARL